MQGQLYLLLISVLFFTACNKGEVNGSFIVDTEVCFTIKHHEEIVEDTEVFLKLMIEDTDFPGYSEFVYDTLIAQEPNNGYVCIKNIVYGKYWVMAKGFDQNWGTTGDDVQGGLFFELTQFEPSMDLVLVVNEF